VRRRALRRRYGRANVWAGEPVLVRIKTAGGAHSFRHSPLVSTTTSGIALDMAANQRPGTVIEVVVGKLKYSYRVGRLAGLPSVTRIKRSA